MAPPTDSGELHPPQADDLSRLMAGCLGLSWLFHLSVWRNLYTFYGPEAAYYLNGRPSWKPAVAALLSCLGFAAVVAGMRVIAHWSRSRALLQVAHAVFLALLIIAIWKFALCLIAQSSLTSGYGIAAYFLFSLLAVAAFGFFFRRPDSTFEKVEKAALCVVPLVIISSLQVAVWLAAGSETLAADRKPASARGPDSTKPRRVVFVLFDELDAEIAFSENAPVALPNFERLRQEGFSHLAVEPSSFATLTAIPELTTGARVLWAEPADAETLHLTRPEGTGSWTSEETIFGWAKESGLRIGIAGWYHPYCRLFRDSLDACTAEPVGSGATAMRSSLVASMMPLGEAVTLQALHEWRLAAAMVFLQVNVTFGVANETEIRYIRRAQLEAFQNLRSAALEYVADPRLDFVFVHLPIPHPVGIFDRETGDYSLDESANYVDNLLLTDRTVGEIRDSIRAAGMESETVLVVGSDHPVRESWRAFPFWSEEMDQLVRSRGAEKIPLFVYVPESAPPAYGEPLGALVVYDLLRLLLEGGSPQPSDWAGWMATRHPAPPPSSD